MYDVIIIIYHTTGEYIIIILIYSCSVESLNRKGLFRCFGKVFFGAIDHGSAHIFR